MKSKDDLLTALLKEIQLQKDFFSTVTGNEKEAISSLYFGGGTPSILEGDELQKLLDALYGNFSVSHSAEVTLEANPDDLDKNKLFAIRKAGINRLSIGVQSFNDDDLRYMNRVHNAQEAESSVKRAQDSGITNISIDLIYGTPTLNTQDWKQNLYKAFSLDVPHLSCYALTVEEKTALSHFIRAGKVLAPDEHQVAEQFNLLMKLAEQHRFEHYEISNFAKENYYSRHNSSYWNGEPYLGIGPSAHSYNFHSRQWNVSNNQRYIQSISEGKVPSETEELSQTERYNETVMISLRTKRGINLEKIKSGFGAEFVSHLENEILQPLENGLLLRDNESIVLTSKGKLFADRIASELFITD